MHKQKHANLVFKNGQMLVIPVHGEKWPPTIAYKRMKLEDQGPREEIIEFLYIGVQHGVGAYVEGPVGQGAV